VEQILERAGQQARTRPGRQRSFVAESRNTMAPEASKSRDSGCQHWVALENWALAE